MKYKILLLAPFFFISCSEKKASLNYKKFRSLELGSERLKIKDTEKNWEIEIVSTATGVSVSIINNYGQVMDYSTHNESASSTNLTYNPSKDNAIIIINAEGKLITGEKRFK